MPMAVAYTLLPRDAMPSAVMLSYVVFPSVCPSVMPNTHRRRRRDSTVELSRVAVGGVYWIRN